MKAKDLNWLIKIHEVGSLWFSTSDLVSKKNSIENKVIFFSFYYYTSEIKFLIVIAFFFVIIIISWVYNVICVSFSLVNLSDSMVVLCIGCRILLWGHLIEFEIWVSDSPLTRRTEFPEMTFRNERKVCALYHCLGFSFFCYLWIIGIWPIIAWWKHHRYTTFSNK